MAMGRSYEAPSFRTDAGARLTMIFWLDFFGWLNPVFLMAEFIRSLDSSTDLSGNPTMVNACRPWEMSVSTVIICASAPYSAAEKMREGICYFFLMKRDIIRFECDVPAAVQDIFSCIMILFQI